MAPTDGRRVALVKDWLTSWGGSEQQLLQLLQLYPQATVYTSVYDAQRLPQFRQYDIRTMRLPSALARGRRFELLAPILPRYFSRLRLDHDLVISVTSGFAKAAVARRGRHICICNTPLRFAWSFGDDRRGRLASLLSPWFRRFDVQSSRGVDLFLANSHNVARRIRQCYGRESEVVFPPVELDDLLSIKPAADRCGWLTVGRLVPYKRVDLIVEAASRRSEPLTIIGDGPELAALRRLAGPTVRFLGFTDRETVRREMAAAAGFIFAAEEDFGIAPVEALAAGLPVVAYGAGGALETVQDKKNGLFFRRQTVPSLVRAMDNFFEYKWSVADCRQRARDFSADRFRQAVKRAADRVLSSGE